jgi:hypothetical protein
MAFNNYRPQIVRNKDDGEIDNVSLDDSKKGKDTLPDGMAPDTTHHPNKNTNKVYTKFNSGKNKVVQTNKDGSTNVDIKLDVNVSNESGDGVEIEFKKILYIGNNVSIHIDNEESFKKKELIEYVNGGVTVDIVEDKVRIPNKSKNIIEYDIVKEPITIEAEIDAADIKRTLKSSQEIITSNKLNFSSPNSIAEVAYIFHSIKIEYQVTNGDGETKTKTITKKLGKPLFVLNTYYSESEDFLLFSLPSGVAGRTIQSSMDKYILKSVPLFTRENLSISTIIAYMGYFMYEGVSLYPDIDSFVLCSEFNDDIFTSKFYYFGLVLNHLNKKDIDIKVHYHNEKDDKYEVITYSNSKKDNGYLYLNIKDIVNKNSDKLKEKAFFITNDSDNKFFIYVPPLYRGIYTINPSVKFSSKLGKDFYLLQNNRGAQQSMQRLMFVEYVTINTCVALAFEAFEEYVFTSIVSRGLGGMSFNSLARISFYIVIALVESAVASFLSQYFGFDRKDVEKAIFESETLHSVIRKTETPKLSADVANTQLEMFKKSYNEKERDFSDVLSSILLPLYNVSLFMKAGFYRENDYSSSIDVSDISMQDFFDYKKTLLLTDEVKWYLVDVVSRFFEANIAQLVPSIFSTDLVSCMNFRKQSKMSFNGEDIKNGVSLNPIFAYKDYIVYSSNNEEDLTVKSSYLYNKQAFINRIDYVLNKLEEKKSSNEQLIFYIKLLKNYAKTSSSWTTIACLSAKQKQDNLFFRDGPLKCIPEFRYNADNKSLKTGNIINVSLNDVKENIETGEKGATKIKLSENIYLYTV